MPINITLGRLVLAVQSKAIEHVSALIPPGAYRFHVAKLIDAVEKEYQAWETQNNALVSKHGVPSKDAAGNDIITMNGTTPDVFDAFSSAARDLYAITVMLPYAPLVWSKFGPEGEKLTINDVRALGPLLVESEEATAPATTPVA